MTSDPTGTPRARHAVSPQLSRRTVLAGLAAAPLVGFAAPRARAATFVDVPLRYQPYSSWKSKLVRAFLH